MLKRNDEMVALMLEDKDIFIAGAIVKNIWENGKPVDKQYMEVVGFVLLDGLNFQEYRFKYPMEMKDKILEIKNKITKVSEMPGYSIEDLYCYKDKYFGQNILNGEQI